MSPKSGLWQFLNISFFFFLLFYDLDDLEKYWQVSCRTSPNLAFSVLIRPELRVWGRILRMWRRLFVPSCLGLGHSDSSPITWLSHLVKIILARFLYCNITIVFSFPMLSFASESLSQAHFHTEGRWITGFPIVSCFQTWPGLNKYAKIVEPSTRRCIRAPKNDRFASILC